MKRYYCVSFIISVLCFIAWMVGMLAYHAPRLGDGNGPDPLGILLYFAAWPVGLFLLHTLVLAWALRKRPSLSIFGGRRGLPINGGLAVVFLGCAIYWLPP